MWKFGLVLASAVAVAGCSSSTDDNDDSRDSAAPTSAAPAARPVEAACTMKGRPVKVSVTDAGDKVSVTFIGQPVTTSGTVGYYVSLWEGENDGAQLGMKFNGGQLEAYFVFDLSGVEQIDMDGEPEVDGDTVTGVFSRVGTALDGMDVDQWAAALSIDGTDVAGCPDREYNLQPFPG